MGPEAIVSAVSGIDPSEKSPGVGRGLLIAVQGNK